jgi:hypothetical protein
MIGRLAAHRRQTSRRLVLRWLNQCIERLFELHREKLATRHLGCAIAPKNGNIENIENNERLRGKIASSNRPKRVFVVFIASRFGGLVQGNGMRNAVGPLQSFGELLDALDRGGTRMIVRHVRSPGSLRSVARQPPLEPRHDGNECFRTAPQRLRYDGRQAPAESRLGYTTTMTFGEERQRRSQEVSGVIST